MLPNIHMIEIRKKEKEKNNM